MLYLAKSTSESSCVKPPRRFGIHSSSLTKAIHKSKITRLIFSLNNMRSFQSQMKKLLIVASQDSMLSAKVTAIKEAKDLATLPLDELIRNLKVYEMVLDNDGVVSKTTKENVKSLALKAKVAREQTSDDSDSQGESDEKVDGEEAEAFNLLARNFRKFFLKGNRSRRGNRFCNGGNQFGKSRGNNFGNKDGERSKPNSRSVPADYVPAGHVIISTNRYGEYADLSYRQPMPTLPTQSPFTYPNPNPSALSSFTQDDSFMLNPAARPYFRPSSVYFNNILPEPRSSSSVEDDRIDEPKVQDLNGLMFRMKAILIV
ncbi:hypothetical protein Tco_0442835 [Tanacetum coccineum]